MLVCSSCHNKYHKKDTKYHRMKYHKILGDLNKRNLFFHGYGCWTSQIKVQQGHFLMILFPSCRRLLSHCVLTWQRKQEQALWGLFLEDTSPIASGPHTYFPYLTTSTSLEFPYPDNHSGGRASTYEFGGDTNIQFITECLGQFNFNYK